MKRLAHSRVNRSAIWAANGSQVADKAEILSFIIKHGIEDLAKGSVWEMLLLLPHPPLMICHDLILSCYKLEQRFLLVPEESSPIGMFLLIFDGLFKKICVDFRESRPFNLSLKETEVAA